LHEQPLVSNSAAAAQVPLHPNSVRLWRRRWATGAFSARDRAQATAVADFRPS
jgi:hypothetical protein